MCGVSPGSRCSSSSAMVRWPLGPEHIDLGIEGGERDRPVARIDGDAGVAAAEQRMAAIDAVDGRAAAARLALVAGERLAAAEIGAAGALQQVAADASPCCGAAARPPARAIPTAPDSRATSVRIGGDVAHPRERAEDQLALPDGIDARSARRAPVMSTTLAGVSTFSFIRS